MIKLNSNKGITLAVLIVVIIVVVILLGISIDMGVDSINESTDEQFKSELYIVQQAIYQKNIEYNEKGISKLIIGIEIENINSYEDFVNAYKEIYGKGTKPKGTYYLIKNEVASPSETTSFAELGLSGKRIDSSEFIVNYETGEVYNNTKKYYSNKEPMYLAGYVNNTTGETTSYMIEITTN